MAKFLILATRSGLNRNQEIITDEALETFVNAFPSKISHYSHAAFEGDYAPKIGDITELYVDGEKAYAEIDFIDSVSDELRENENVYVSVAAMTMGEYNDNWEWQVNSFIEDDRNSIDIVPFGAVVDAKVVGEIKDSVDKTITQKKIICSATIVSENTKGDNMSDVNISEDSLNAIVAKLKDELSVETPAQAVVDPAETPVVEPAKEETPVVTTTDEVVAEDEVDTEAAVKDALNAIADSELPISAIKHIADNYKVGVDIVKLIDSEKELVNSIKNELTVETKVYGSSKEAPTAKAKITDR